MTIVSLMFAVLTLFTFPSRSWAQSLGGPAVCDKLTDQECNDMLMNASYYPIFSLGNSGPGFTAGDPVLNASSESDPLGSKSAGLMLTAFPDVKPAETGGSWWTLQKEYQGLANQKDKALQDWEGSLVAQRMAVQNPDGFSQYVAARQQEIGADERFADKYKKVAVADSLKANQARPRAERMTLGRCERVGAGSFSPTCTALLQNINYSKKTDAIKKVASSPKTVQPSIDSVTPQGQKVIDKNSSSGLGRAFSKAARHIDEGASQLKKSVTKSNSRAKKIALMPRKLKPSREKTSLENQPVKSNDLVCFRYESELSQKPFPFIESLQKTFDRDCRGKTTDDSKTNQNEVSAKQQNKIVEAYGLCVNKAAAGQGSSAAEIHACAQAKIH